MEEYRSPGQTIIQYMLGGVLLAVTGGILWATNFVTSAPTSTDNYNATQEVMATRTKASIIREAEIEALAAIQEMQNVAAEATANSAATLQQIYNEIATQKIGATVTKLANEASMFTPTPFPSMTPVPPIVIPTNTPVSIVIVMPSSTPISPPTNVPASTQQNVQGCIDYLKGIKNLNLTGADSLSTWVNTWQSTWPQEAVINPPLTELSDLNEFFNNPNGNLINYHPFIRKNAQFYLDTFQNGSNTPLQTLLSDSNIYSNICRPVTSNVPSTEMVSSSIDSVSQATGSLNVQSIELTQNSAFLMVLAGVTAYEYIIKPGVTLARENDLRAVPGLLVQEYRQNIVQGAQNFVNQVRHIGNSAEFAFYVAKGTIKNLVPKCNSPTGNLDKFLDTYDALA
jgi:hypothetical protein